MPLNYDNPDVIVFKILKLPFFYSKLENNWEILIMVNPKATLAILKSVTWFFWRMVLNIKASGKFQLINFSLGL
jgi:hypothetical protein